MLFEYKENTSLLLRLEAQAINHSAKPHVEMKQYLELLTRITQEMVSLADVGNCILVVTFFIPRQKEK